MNPSELRTAIKAQAFGVPIKAGDDLISERAKKIAIARGCIVNNNIVYGWERYYSEAWNALQRETDQ